MPLPAAPCAHDLGPVRRWLAVVLLLILAMFAVGAITRLTDSGLSIVEWKPLLGAIPPLNEQQWEEVFFAYRQYPEYQLRREGMTLGEFKTIFFWEYFHRLLGRFLGLAYAIPFAVFLVRRLPKRLALLLGLGLVLGGLQGALGWFMVMSGLQDTPYVSPFRLAAHLMMALALFCYLFWIWSDLLPPANRRDATLPGGARFALAALFVLLLVQMVYGAFVAGLNAGWQYNTFPKMMGRWIPPGLLSLDPAWVNVFQNAATVQFIHRALAGLLLVGGLAVWLRCRARLPSGRAQLYLDLFGVLLTVQFGLGVATLLLHVPIVLATMHQVLAVLLAAAMTGLHAELRRSSPGKSLPASAENSDGR